MKILIAEDDPVASKILKLTLQQGGHEVRVVTDGAEAWSSYEAAPVGLVISDWMMPEVDGLELCRRIRARGEKDYTYFMLLTANHAGLPRTRRRRGGRICRWRWRRGSMIS